MVDGVEVSITTSKIISEDEKKDEEMRFLRQAWEGTLPERTGWGGVEGWAWGGSFGERAVYRMKSRINETKGNCCCLRSSTPQPTHSLTHPPFYPFIHPSSVHPSMYPPTHQVGGHGDPYS